MTLYNINYCVIDKTTGFPVGRGYTYKRQAIANAKYRNDWTGTKNYYVRGGLQGKGYNVVWKP